MSRRPIDLESPAGSPSCEHVHWITEAGLEPDAPRLRGRAAADVCVIGGGYQGLWTALSVRRREPKARVVLVEARRCGFGASGRNGGIVQSWWTKFPTLRRLYGADEAVFLCEAADGAIDEIDELCRDEPGVFRRTGWLWTASNRAQLDSWRTALEEVEMLGRPDPPFVELTGDQIRARSGSARHLGGILEPRAGAVQPAKLVGLLRSEALRSGVQIFENSPVAEIVDGEPATVRSADGTLEAERVVVATGAWIARAQAFRRRLFVVSSDMVATEPAPERLRSAGLLPNLAVSDSRMLVNYYQVTTDGRLAWGRGGGALGFGNRVGPKLVGLSPRAPMIMDAITSHYPSLADLEAETSWAGPVDRSEHGLPIFGHWPGTRNVIFAAGYSGNGVGPAVIGGRILAEMAFDGAGEWARSALTRDRQAMRAFPPEPVRFLGGLAVRTAVQRKERAEDEDRRTGPVSSRLAALSPAGSKE